MADEKKQEFWRWTESNWKNPDIKWEEAKFITAGIDVGSVSSQACIMADGEVFAYSNMRTPLIRPFTPATATFILMFKPLLLPLYKLWSLIYIRLENYK